MRIVSIGGGPAGLYTSILLAKALPDATIEVFERNRADDTFGWGVVFSAATLEHFREEDAESYDAITNEFIYWDDIQTWYGDTWVRSTGHGFCGMSRKRLLVLLQERATQLGVKLHFEHAVDTLSDVGPADLVLVADGLNSAVRDAHAEVFQPELDWRACKFTWLGTTMPMDAFTFLFRENEHGLFSVHAYPFERLDDGTEERPGLGTFIVECREETWRAAGLDTADEAATIAYFTELFADHLDGAELLANRSIWRTFPTVKNATWHHENMVLLGDAAHTAHFSIGSGTKLAMEDAIALKNAVVAHGTSDIPALLAAYEDARWVEVAKLQKAAQTSLEWFEHTARYTQQHPLQFSFNLMSRSKQITYDNLALRDPALVARVREWWWDEEHARFLAADGAEAEWPARQKHTEESRAVAAQIAASSPGKQHAGRAPAPLFAPLRLRELTLPNRVVVSPMCQYSAMNGEVNDWHLVHLGARATGGAGLVITEMTDVSAEGRITYGCAGLWNDAQQAAWARIVSWIHANSPAKVAVQLAHAGRKGSCSRPWEGDAPLSAQASANPNSEPAWETVAPSALPFNDGWPAPREMDRSDMDKVRDDFVAATQRALAAGFDMIELHMAHGYLLSEFLSPACNRRDDEYGGSLENRLRFPLEVFDAVRAAWPDDKPLAVRLSATDWLDDPDAGMTVDDTVSVTRTLGEHGCDLVDISSGGNTPASVIDFGRMYQVPFAERVRAETSVPVMAVGAISGHDQVNTILAAGRADLCALARPHLENPSIVLGASAAYEQYDQWWPAQYSPAKPRPRRTGRR